MIQSLPIFWPDLGALDPPCPNPTWKVQHMIMNQRDHIPTNLIFLFSNPHIVIYVRKLISQCQNLAQIKVKRVLDQNELIHSRDGTYLPLVITLSEVGHYSYEQ